MRDPMNGASVSIYNVDEEIVGHSNGLSDLLNSARNHILEQPNMGVVRKERLRRNKMAMKVISPAVANHVMGMNPVTKEEAAALCIQCHFRGYLARKQYISLLYEQYEKEEAERLEKIRQQVEEGQILVDNYHLKQEMEENDCLRRNKRRNEDCSAITIQRLWRQYSTKLHEKLVGLKIGHESNKVKRGEGDGEFNSFAVSPFENDFYEEDMFHNQSESEEQLGQCMDDEPDEDFDTKEMDYTEAKPELNDGYLPRSLSANSESAGLDEELPPPTTDWESIDNYLKSDQVQSCSDGPYSPDPKVINRLSAGPDYLQLCFGDDNALTDEEESQEEAEIKEYVIEEYSDKSEEGKKRNSGCDPEGEKLNLEPAEVKIINPEELESTKISQEETTQVLLELESVNEPPSEKHTLKMNAMRKKLERFSVRHLETQSRDLRLKIKEISDELVRELLIRDQLHTKQDALLMDVEDAVKYARTNHQLSQK